MDFNPHCPDAFPGCTSCPPLPSANETWIASNFNPTSLPSVSLGPEGAYGALPVALESLNRLKCCAFIDEMSVNLTLPHATTLTAHQFLHRFYTKQQLAHHDRFQLAVVCLFLSCKVEETPRKIALVLAAACTALKTHYGLLGGKEGQGFAGSGVKVVYDKTGAVDVKNKEFTKLKESILLRERILLHTLSFDLSLDHAKSHIMDFVKKTVSNIDYNHRSAGNVIVNATSAPPVTMQTVAQRALGLANDASYTTLCLEMSAGEIARAAVGVAVLSFDYVDKTLIDSQGKVGGLKFFEMLGSTPEHMTLLQKRLDALYHVSRQVV